jgi:hypothetical protein
MPRRNRPIKRRQRQHGKVGQQSKRPRGWHRDYRSADMKAAEALLRGEAAA